MSDRFTQLARKAWPLPDFWTVGAVLIAAVVLVVVKPF